MELNRFKHFEIDRLLGRGGMGEVYLAHDANLERQVALKLLPRELLRDPAAQGRLLDEARSISRVQHPNIAVIHSIEEDGGVYALCMEYIEGLSLKELLQRKGPLPLRQILHVAAQVAAGMQAAHEAGIVHRDLKPANVMVTTGGEAKVMDFGLALRPQRVVDTVGTSTYGTVQYMSPEQARGETLDARSDIFSFGSTLYELATGRPPFEGANDLSVLQAILNEEPKRLRDVRRDLPPAFEQFVRGCMAKPVGARWESMAAVRDELKYLTPVANAGPRDLINELSSNLTEKEDGAHKPRNHGAVGRRPGHLTPPSGAQSGPTPTVKEDESVDFADVLPEGVVIHEIVDRGIVEVAEDSDAQRLSDASKGLDIQTTSQQWQEIASKSRRIDIIRREVAAREEARARSKSTPAISQSTDGLKEVLDWHSDAGFGESQPRTDMSSRRVDSLKTSPKSTGPSSGSGSDPFVGPDPARRKSRPVSTPKAQRDSRWKILLPMLLALILAAAGAWAILHTAGLDPAERGEREILEEAPAEATPTPGAQVRSPQSATSSEPASPPSASFASFGAPQQMPLVDLPRPPRTLRPAQAGPAQLGIPLDSNR